VFLSALSIFSLMSVTVARRTREIGVRTALGANPRQVLAQVLSRAMMLTSSRIAAGGAFLLFLIELWGEGRTSPGGLCLTSAVMLAACLLTCIEPARRALRINPTDALRQA
jgi:putative ABC transport system permease protein